jgi:hypothetical protein
MYLFSYFKTRDESMYLAVSEDGFIWNEWNDGRPVLKGADAGGMIRDPFLFKDTRGRFHAVWTTGWESASIGYAWSDNLLEWRDIRLLPVMNGREGTINCWAPEVCWDAAAGAFRLIWSSTVLQPLEKRKRDHRIWSVLTNDFERLSDPAVYFDPGYNVIDATIVDLGDRQMMFFKDERGSNEPDTTHKAIRSCPIGKNGAPDVGGISELLTPALSEGPTLYPVMDGGVQYWIMLYDMFSNGRYGAARSVDLVHWEDVTDLIHLPPDPRHGSVLRL